MSTFEIHDPADEPQISLAPEDLADELPEELQSPEDIAARTAQAEADKQAEIDRKAEETNSVINKFAGILKVIEDSPSPQRQAAPEQAPQLPPQPTQEQINEWNDKLRELQVTNPLQYATMMREGAVEEAQRRILSQSGGIISSSAKGFVKDFKSEKKGSSPFYDQIAKRFDVEVKDLPAQAILQMSDEQRDREFTRRWKAAAGDFYEENAKPTQTLATTASRGTSMAPSSGTRNNRPKVVELSDGEKLSLLRALGKDKAKVEIAKIEYGLA
jgi:hypothetical protein